MNTDPSINKGDLNIGPTSLGDAEKSIQPVYHETNITEGSEFLDDAIRMKDQPLEEPSTKENQQTKFQTNKINYYEHY